MLPVNKPPLISPTVIQNRIWFSEEFCWNVNVGYCSLQMYFENVHSKRGPVIMTSVFVVVTLAIVRSYVTIISFRGNFKLRPVYTYRHRPCQIYIVWIVMDHLMDRLGSEPILCVKRSVSILLMRHLRRLSSSSRFRWASSSFSR